MYTFQKQCTLHFKRWRRAGYAIFATLRRQVAIGVLSVGMSTILLSTATPAKAQKTSDADTLTLQTLEIERIEVIGYRHDARARATGPGYSISQTIDASAPTQTLESVLRLSPAVDLRERGGRGTQADISIRGGSFDQTMVMLNGINFTDARTGHQSLQLPIDLSAIGDLELIDGMAGVGAYAGALNVRTRPLRPRYLRIEGAGGMDGYAYGNLSGAYTTRGLNIFAAGSYRRSDGYRHNTDFDNWNGYVRMNYDSRAGFFDFQAGYQRRAWGSNGFYAAYNPDQFERTETFLGSLRWLKRLGRLTLNATASYRKNLDRYDWVRGTAMNYHDTDNAGGELWGDLQWAGGITSLGVDYTYNHIFSTNLGDPLPAPHGRYTNGKARHVGNVWLRHVKRWRRFDVTGSAGVSATSYGTTALWSVSGGWRPAHDWYLEAGVVQSMRLPTFTDLYYTSPAHLNNLNLKPEQAITSHVALSYERNGWNASLYGFYRAGHNIIDWVWREELNGRPLGKWHSEQESRLNTYGVESTGGYTAPTGFFRRATLSYGYTNTSKVTRVVTSGALDYMRHKAVAALEFRFLRDFSLVFTGALYDRNGNYTHYLRGADGALLVDGDGKMQTEVRDFKPYFLLDGRLTWEKGSWKVYLDTMNMTDTRYFDFGGMPLPGFWLSGGVIFTI